MGWFSISHEDFLHAAWTGKLRNVRKYIDSVKPTSAELDEALVKASAAGHLAIVELLVSHGANVDALHDFTPLTAAVANGEVAVARWLLTHGADVNKAAYKGQTALHWAIDAEWNEFRTAEPDQIMTSCVTPS